MADYRAAPISEAEKALFAFVEKVNRASPDMTEADVETALRTGWTEEALYDAINVCSLFNFYNRWVDAAGVRELSPEEYRLAGQRLARRGYRIGVSAAVEAVEGYLRALNEKDLSLAPLAPEVTFEGPLSPKLYGEKAVREFLSGLLPGIVDLRVQQHISEGEYVATRFEIHTPNAVIPVCDCFHVIDGRIVEIRPYYDPRPLL